MASNQFFVGFVAMVAITLPLAMATEYLVGDDQGWKVGVNYTKWADCKVFYVGDKLVFRYQAPHDVFGVDGAAFKACNASSGKLFNSGKDTITLSLPGKKWYICGVPGHCEAGQKLVISIQSDGPVTTPAPTCVSFLTSVPAPGTSDSYRFLSYWYQILAAVVVIIATIIV